MEPNKNHDVEITKITKENKKPKESRAYDDDSSSQDEKKRKVDDKGKNIVVETEGMAGATNDINAVDKGKNIVVETKATTAGATNDDNAVDKGKNIVVETKATAGATNDDDAVDKGKNIVVETKATTAGATNDDNAVDKGKNIVVETKATAGATNDDDAVDKGKNIVVETKATTAGATDDVSLVNSSDAEELFLTAVYSTGSSSDSDDSSSDSTEFSDGLGMDELVDEPKIFKFDTQKESYKVLSETEIRQCQEDDVTNLANALLITTAEAIALLLHYNWNMNTAIDNWFADPDKIRYELGLIGTPTIGVESSSSHLQEVICGNCLGAVPPSIVASASCGHQFCKPCWQDFLGKSLQDNMTNLSIKCPKPSCIIAVTRDMIIALASENDRALYDSKCMNSYILHKARATWCPASGCNRAVILEASSNITNVTCNCFHTFCWKCMNEAHQPVSCETAQKWQLECTRPSENSDKGKGKGKAIDQNDSTKFNEYFRQWKKHDEDKQEAVVELVRQIKQLNNKAHKQGVTDEDYMIHMSFITESCMSSLKEGWLQIAECKRVMKWACVHEYYLPDNGNENKSLSNFLQGQAAFVLEQLYQCAAELTRLTEMGQPCLQFLPLTTTVGSKTRVARNYYENMLKAFDSDNKNMNALLWMFSGRKPTNEKPADTGNRTSGKEKHVAAVNVDETSYWTCPECGIPNDLATTICIMCYH